MKAYGIKLTGSFDDVAVRRFRYPADEGRGFRGWEVYERAKREGEKWDSQGCWNRTGPEPCGRGEVGVEEVGKSTRGRKERARSGIPKVAGTGMNKDNIRKIILRNILQQKRGHLGRIRK